MARHSVAPAPTSHRAIVTDHYPPPIGSPAIHPCSASMWHTSVRHPRPPPGTKSFFHQLTNFPEPTSPATTGPSPSPVLAPSPPCPRDHCRASTAHFPLWRHPEASTRQARELAL